MPQNITDVDTWTTPLQDLADGDLIDGAAFLAAQQGVGNRTEFLRKRVIGAESETIMFPLIAMPLDTSLATAWTFGNSGSAYAINQGTTGSAGLIFLELALPKSCRLTTLSVILAGATGHVALPATMPTVQLHRQDTGSVAAPTLVASATDTSATFAAYELAHAVTLTGLSEVIAHSGNRWYVRVSGETGANSVAGLALLSLEGTVTPA